MYMPILNYNYIVLYIQKGSSSLPPKWRSVTWI